MHSLLNPLFIRDESIVGVLLPNTAEFVAALKQFVSSLEIEKEEFNKWVKELESPAAHKRYDAIISDSDGNDGWVKSAEVEKEFLISS